VECRQLFEGVACGAASWLHGADTFIEAHADDVWLARAFLIPAIHAPHASVRHCFGAHPMALRRKIAGKLRLVHHPPQGKLEC